MRAGLVGTAAFSLCFLLLAASSGRAQSPPSSAPPPSGITTVCFATVRGSATCGSAAPAAAAPLPGFVPPYEITKIVRASGFDPLAPPRREGTTYVVRATDFRGILMRVVVDARSGALRAVNRIVPGPAPYGVVGMMTPPYGPPALWSAAVRAAALWSGVRATSLWPAALRSAGLRAGRHWRSGNGPDGGEPERASAAIGDVFRRPFARAGIAATAAAAACRAGIAGGATGGEARGSAGGQARGSTSRLLGTSGGSAACSGAGRSPAKKPLQSSPIPD